MSLNKFFVKVPRSKDEPGKGGFWKFDVDCLEGGARRKRTSKHDDYNLFIRKNAIMIKIKSILKPISFLFHLEYKMYLKFNQAIKYNINIDLLTYNQYNVLKWANYNVFL